MTTKLAYRYVSEIDYASLDYNPDEKEPLPDSMYQDPILQELLPILSTRYAGSGRSRENFLGSNTIVCYDPANLNRRVMPDCYLAFGVDVEAIRRRKIYLPWEVGKPPDLVLEVGSESTRTEDLVRKRDIYARIGVGEYWRLDVTGGDYYGEPLVGEELVEGQYQRFPLSTEPDGILKSYSPLLDLYLCWEREWFYFYDPVSGTYLRNLAEAEEALFDREAALRDREAALQAEREARRDREAALRAEREALRAEQEARQRAEARVRQLEEELRRRQGES